MSQSNGIDLVVKSGEKVIFDIRKPFNSSSSPNKLNELVVQLKSLKEEVNSKITDLINSSGDTGTSGNDIGDDYEDEDDDENLENKEDKTNSSSNKSNKRSGKERRSSKKKRKHK